ncbi:MAG: DUF1573 domain-containing protein [Saprospiraceae bacterium]|nr:DUF1573 domain-containing protein [Saprospiraceae bacterium]
MKNFRILALFAFVAALSFTACKDGKSDAQDAARESLATTQTTTPTTTPPAATPAQPAAPVGPLTSITFEETEYDFGTVQEGEKVIHEYKFKNTGKEPLVISNAKGSCGCTVPEWPREPIPVGGESSIRVQFDSKGKGKVGGGQQTKKVTITANTDPANTFLNIKGIVNKPAES